MTAPVVGDDPVLAALGRLGDQDVDARRAHALQVRCRAMLAAQKRAADVVTARGSLRRMALVASVLAAAWCAAYVIEVVRLAAVVYRR